MNQKVRSSLLVTWALVSVPLFVTLFSYFGIAFLGHSESAVPAFIWLVVCVFAIASGLGGLLSVLPPKLLLRVVVGVAYVAATYPVVLGLSFIGACAYGGCG